jgi:hypothetical protein
MSPKNGARSGRSPKHPASKITTAVCGNDLRINRNAIGSRAAPSHGAITALRKSLASASEPNLVAKLSAVIAALERRAVRR